jgi:hypothetical protein
MWHAWRTQNRQTSSPNFLPDEPLFYYKKSIVSLMVRYMIDVITKKCLNCAMCLIFHTNKGMTQKDQNTEYFHIVA